MSAADWYPDPTRGGRLRYWDGLAWTEHVSVDGEVASEPIQGLAPAPPRADDAASGGAAHDAGSAAAQQADAPTARPAAGVAGIFASGGPGGPTTLGRIGFGIATVGAVVASLASGRVVVEQDVSSTATNTISLGGASAVGITILAAVVCVGGMLAPWLWMRVSAAVVAWAAGAVLAFAVIGMRTSEDNLVAGVDISLGPGGVLMVVGTMLLFVGAAVAVWGIRTPVTEVDPSAVENPREGKGISSLVTGIVSFIIIVPAPAAISLGLAARDDDRASAGKTGYRGMAMAGIVLGIVAMAAWGLGLTAAMFLTTP